MSQLMQYQDLDRVSELLAEEAALGLGMQELEELNALLPQPEAARARRKMMEAAALAQLAFLKRDTAGSRQMPAQLRARLAAMGQAQTASSASARPTARPVADLAAERQRRQAPATRPAAEAGARVWHRNPAIGWSVAAALALAVVVFRVQDTGGPAGIAVPALPDERQALLADPATITMPWSPPTESAYEGVRGEVVWNGARQSGYLRLTGMPVNDPSSAQYQLWIVDPSRDRQHPVDGGVFNVASTGEVIVPIDAKLPITAPVVFAITLEQPGGVVVSAGPLLVVAARS